MSERLKERKASHAEGGGERSRRGCGQYAGPGVVRRGREGPGGTSHRKDVAVALSEEEEAIGGFRAKEGRDSI